MGIEDAHTAIGKGATASFDDLIHYHAMKKQGDPRMLKHSYGTFVDAKALGEFEDYDILKDDYMKKYTYNFVQE